MNERDKERVKRFRELADQYKLAVCRDGVWSDKPYVIFDSIEFEDDMSKGLEYIVDLGMGDGTWAASNQLPPVAAVLVISRLAYDLLNRAGFSLHWDGNPMLPILIQPEATDEE